MTGRIERNILREIIFYYIKIHLVILGGSAATCIDKRGYPIAYIPSFETKEIYDKRIKLLDLINENKNYYYASGSLNEIINFINKLNNVNISDKQKVLERRK